MRRFSFGLVLVFVLGPLISNGCGRAGQSAATDAGAPQNADGGDAGFHLGDAGDAGAISDGGASIGDAGLSTDAGQTNDSTLCPANAVPPPPAEGGLIWQTEHLPSISPRQEAGWVRISTDTECDSLTPTNPPANLTWVADAGIAACVAATVDGQGDLSVNWGNGNTALTSFFIADGSAASSVTNGTVHSLHKEDQIWVAPGPSGFVMASLTFNPWCNFLRPLSSIGNPGPPTLIEAPDPDQIVDVKDNPQGGYVLLRTTSDGKQPATQTLELRFVNQDLQARSEWQTVFVYHRPGDDEYPALNITWRLKVDQQGHALVLAFAFPPSFGPPPPPNQWKFAARWMGPNGPLSDLFAPVAPRFSPDPSSGFPLFAGWGSMVALAGGGFAMFHYQVDASYPGTVSPTGWYAFYPSGTTDISTAPDWLQPYDGSLQLLAGGNEYASIQLRDPKTCARTMLLSAQSGRACFTLDVAGTNECPGFPDAIWPDGTYVIQNGVSTSNSCWVQWWPGLARSLR